MDVKHFKAIMISLLSIFAPIQSVLLTTLVLIVSDLITGVISAIKRKEAITSSGFKRSVIKILIYELAIIFAFITEQYLTGPAVPIIKIVAGFVGLTELTSIIENLNEISGGSLMTALVQKLGAKKDELS